MDNINISIGSSDIDPITGEGISTNININTSDKSELFRLLTLAGLSPDTIDVEYSEPVTISGEDGSDVSIDDIEDEEIVPEQADYDYGKNPTSRKGHQLSIDPYEYEGTANEPVRYTPARMADNPLEGKSFLSYLNNIINEKRK